MRATYPSVIALALIAGFSGATLPLAPALAQTRPSNLADLVAQVADAVVNISATQTLDEKSADAGPPGARLGLADVLASQKKNTLELRRKLCEITRKCVTYHFYDPSLLGETPLHFFQRLYNSRPKIRRQKKILSNF